MSDSWFKIVRELGKTFADVRKVTEDAQKSVEDVLDITKTSVIPSKPPLPKPPWRIFLSSVIKDMAEERARVKQSVEALPGLAQTWMWEEGGYASPIKTPEEEYLPEVRDGHFFLMIIKDDVTAPVRKEYDTACQSTKPMLVFVKNCERTPAAQELVDAIGKQITYAVFTDSEELDPATGKADRLKDLDDKVRSAVAHLVIDKFEIDDTQRRALEEQTAVLEKQIEEREKKIGHLETERNILAATAVTGSIATATATAAMLQATSQSSNTEPAPHIETLLFKPDTRTDRYGKLMVRIPAGLFTMGSDESDDEKPIHQVYLDEYWIDETPVTNAEYLRFVTATGRSVPYNEARWAKPYNWHKVLRTYPVGLDNHPVVLIAWEDANEYAHWAGKRLPTEAQWEKAARGGHYLDGDVLRQHRNPLPERRYPWGNYWDRKKCNSASWWINEDIVPSNWGNEFHKHYWNEWKGNRVLTTSVGQFKEGISLYGVMDMIGNVWEWCSDWYNECYYTISPKQNPPGPSSAESRVVRGGSCYDNATKVRLAKRDVHNPDDGAYYHAHSFVGFIGFRCAQ